MARKSPRSSTALPEEVAADLQTFLGYLNFSSGIPDPGFQACVNRLYRYLGPNEASSKLYELASGYLNGAGKKLPAFADAEQANAVLGLVFGEIHSAYRLHHADLLFHLSDSDFKHPFLLARMFEATLAQGSPWDETERITEGALAKLNDFVGHRPVAVLESGRKMEPYPHERFRPVPIYLQGAGVETGRYEALITRTLEILDEFSGPLLDDAYFTLAQLEELAVDVRAYDQNHPVYKRTNYTFGEWDPHQIDNKGRYTRFVVRKIVIDALLDWMESARDMSEDEALFQAAAALCGTMLMASSISGSGPDTHTSDISLISLLPRVARHRDAFYEMLLSSLSGPLQKRLLAESAIHRQPFGRVRQYLNLRLADYGAQQLQHVQMSSLFARMGYPQAAREEAYVIPSASARFECAIQCCITSSNIDLDHGKMAEAAARACEISELLHRGIDCGALVDPWNILGFQGLFPLFVAREDAHYDRRVDVLIDLVERSFTLFARLMSEASAVGDQTVLRTISEEFRGLADFWDRFATTTVTDLPAISGSESWESATHVANMLAQWREAGEAAGDIAFWRGQVDRLQSPKSYALVVKALLDRGDSVAAMGLLMQWLSAGESVSLESGPYSFHPLAGRWLDSALAASEEEDAAATAERVWPTVAKFFDYLEANAGAYWSVPTLDEAELPRENDLSMEEAEEEVEDDDEDNLFGAAYENVTFKDSAQDGQIGDTFDDDRFARDSEFDSLSSGLRDRLIFLANLTHMRQLAASTMVAVVPQNDDEIDENIATTISHWREHDTKLLRGLRELIEAVWSRQSPGPAGDQDSLIEYDRQSQLKYDLLRMLIIVYSKCRESSRTLLCCLPNSPKGVSLRGWEAAAIELYRAIFRSDVAETKRLLPPFLAAISRMPFLYVPLNEGGDPRDIAGVRTLQNAIQFLLEQLPRLGLLRETWQTLKTAYQMERRSHRAGVTITEFAGLFSTALHGSLETIIRSSSEWDKGEFTDEQLIQVVGEISDFYLQQWLEHSPTMRVSHVEAIADRGTWAEVKWFIRTYGQDLFYGGNLTLGGIRAILSRGVDSYFEFLKENDDPIRPTQLVEDLNSGLDSEEAAYSLEIVLRCLQDKYDRFIEYNSTTTQSDYGENIYLLLAFLRLEADYDRKAWDLAPVAMVHEALARNGATEAAEIWQDVFQIKTADLSQSFLRNLDRLERACSIKLPSLRDRLSERFVKPLTLDRILALVPQAVEDARAQVTSSSAFEMLREQAAEYMETTSGSAMDVPPWLYSLENEVAKLELPDFFDLDALAVPVSLPKVNISLREFSRQIEDWNNPLDGTEEEE